MANKNFISKLDAGTLVETVVAVGVGGLIFMMIFQAVPHFYANERDTQRKKDSQMISAALIDYMTYNRGKMPKTSKVAAEIDVKNKKRTQMFAGNGLLANSDELWKYLPELESSDVTSVVSVANLTIDEGKFAEDTVVKITDNAEVHSTIEVYIGAQCVEYDQKEGDFHLRTTHVKTDVSILRYLENSGWYCLDG